VASFLDGVILGVVEGLTEFLPVSSTGHLILMAKVLGLKHSSMENFAVMVQFGAILAVGVYYRDRVKTLIQGALGKHERGLKLLKLLIVAFIPAVIVGLLAGDFIADKLFGPRPVALALIVGGVAMIIAERAAKRVENYPIASLEQATFKDALIVGCVQCLALWPGMSRSMTTIVGAQLRGFSNVAAAEFSFLLALPTLGAATIYKFFDAYKEMQGEPGFLQALFIGNVVSFVVAFIAVWTFIRLVEKVGMTPFGIYRIVLGIVVFALI